MAQSRRLRVSSGEIVSLLDNETTTDPTTGDDSGDGYAIGSVWINTTADTTFIAVDVTAAAAVWNRVLKGDLGATDNRLLRSDGTDKTTAQNTGITCDDSDKVTGATTITFGEYDNGSSGATKTIDYNNGQKQRLTLTANCTITLTAPTSGEGNFILKIIQDATGGWDITWPASVKTPGVDAVITALTANQYTIANFYHDAANNDNLSIPKDSSDNASPFT